MKNKENSKSGSSKKGVILGGILVVLVIGIGLFIASRVMNPPMSDEERSQAMEELSKWAEEKKQNDSQITFGGVEDIHQFIADYETISGRKLDYDKTSSSSIATIYDGICCLQVTNYNTSARGNFKVTLKFENPHNDEHYRSAIETILLVFGMKDDDVHKLTDNFASVDSFRYSFDKAFVDQNYHDDLRIYFQSSQKWPGKSTIQTHGSIEITAYHYPLK